MATTNPIEKRVCPDCGVTFSTRDRRRCAYCSKGITRKYTLPDYSTWHKLTDINRESMSAHCSMCNSMVEIIFHGTNAKCKAAMFKSYIKAKSNLTATFEQVNAAKLKATKCAICSITFLSAKDKCADHNHNTGALRDILCPNCNAGLGQFKDNSDLLDKAAEYLRKHQA